MERKQKLSISIIGIILFFLAWALFFHYYPIENLIERIGIKNVYLIAFVFSIIGGFSSITGLSLYAGLAVLARSGVNPYLLGLIAGVGIFISDSLFYFLLSRMKSVITSIHHRSQTLFDKVWRFLYRMPSWVVFFGIYLYAGFAPIPNDILLAVLALSSYEYKEFAPFLFLGDLTGMILLTTVAAASV